MLDDWEVCLYTISPFLQLKVDMHHSNTYFWELSGSVFLKINAYSIILKINMTKNQCSSPAQH